MVEYFYICVCLCACIRRMPVYVCVYALVVAQQHNFLWAICWLWEGWSQVNYVCEDGWVCVFVCRSSCACMRACVHVCVCARVLCVWLSWQLLSNQTSFIDSLPAPGRGWVINNIMWAGDEQRSTINNWTTILNQLYYLCACVCIRVHLRMPVCMYIVYVHSVCTCLTVCTCVCMHVHMWVCMCMRVRMWACVCVCVLVVA